MFQCALIRFAASETFVIRSLLGRAGARSALCPVRSGAHYQTPELRPSMVIVRRWVSVTQSENGGFRAVNRLLPDLRPVCLSAGRSPCIEDSQGPPGKVVACSSPTLRLRLLDPSVPRRHLRALPAAVRPHRLQRSALPRHPPGTSNA